MRFPEFEGEWDFELFSDLFTFLSNNTLSRAELSETGNIRNIHYGDILVRYTDVINVDDEIMPFVSNASESKVRCGMLRTGDVIIADTAEDATVGKAIEIINYNNKPVVSGLHTMPCRPNRDFIASFLGYYINSNAYHSQLYPYMQGIKVTSISKANIGKTLIHFPSRSEQKKIVELFNLIEKKILIQKKLVEAIKLYKRGLLSKLFPQKGESVPQYRFTGFTDAWEQRKLGEVFKERTERAVGDEELLSVTIGSGVIRQADSDKRNIASEDKSNYKIVCKGDVPYNSMRMWQGAVGNSEYDGIVSPAYTVLVPTAQANGKFFMELFMKESTLKIFQRWSQGLTSDTWNLKYPVLSSIEFYMPSMEEQTKIAEYFKSLDRLITLHQRKCNEMQSIKKFMLQNMFV